MELIRSSVIHFEANNIKLTRSIGGVFFIEFETNYKIYSGDTVRITGNDNKTYSFIVSEINKTSYKADHISYELKRYLLFNEFNRPDFGYVNLTACIALLTPILSAKNFTLSVNFDAGQTKYTKDITFADDNLLSALQKICDVFKLELRFEDSTVLLAERLGAIESVQTINAGINSNPITKKISRNNIVSVVYPKGSGENLPEYYPFSELRPITFDMATKSIPSYDFNELKVSNAETITNYGIIEKPVQFEDVRIVSKRAVIDSFSVDGDKCILRIVKTNLGANFMDSVGVSLLNNKTTLVITKNLKLLENVRLAEYTQDDTHYIFKYAKEQSGIDVSTWDFTNGTLILFGYIRQDDYDAAKTKLIAEAQKYLDENKAPEIEYSVDMTYFIDYIDISSLAFDIGDTVKLIDETEDINTDVRVIEYTFDINKGYFTTVKFSNFINKMPYDIIQEQIDLRNSLEKQKTFSDGLAIRLRDTLNKHELLVKSNFYGEENEYVRIGAQDRNFVITGLTITPDDGLKGKISWTSCQFQLVVSDTVFNIAAGNQTLANGIYFLEVKVVNGGNTGEIEILTTKKAGEDAGYTYYPFGAVEVTTDKPTEIATSYGLTLIDGGLIKTQTITADLLNVSQLSAITANVGTLTAGVLQNNKTKIDLTNDIITVNENTVKIGKGALSDNSDGISVKGKIEIKDVAGTKSILSGAGLRQIYSITAIDQIDASYGLSIPVNIPENTIDGTSFGVARAIITVEPFRSFAKAASTGGGSTDVELNLNLQIAASPVWESNPFTTSTPKSVIINDVLQTQSVNVFLSSISGSISDSGSHSHTASTSIASDGSHSHTFEGSDSVSMSHSVEIATDTALSGDYAHSHYGAGTTDTVSELVAISGNTSSSTTHSHTATTSISSDGSHSHTFSNIPHAHTADIPLHYHSLPNLSHTHAINTTGSTGWVDLPNHAHNLDFGIFQSSAIATVTVKKGSTVIGTIQTNNSGDFKDISVVNGDQINITSDNLARVKVFIFVEYMLKI